jgi:heme A synthase
LHILAPAHTSSPRSLAAPVLIIVGGQNLWAYGYSVCEGWPYMRAWYHCMTTFTTVGYGDVSIQTDTGKLVAIFHILFS